MTEKSVKVATEAKKMTRTQKRVKKINRKLSAIVKASERRLGSGTVHLKRSVNGTMRISVRKQKVTKPMQKKPLTVRKPIGGEKNGEFRNVLVKKRPNYYPAVHKTHGRRINRARPHWNKKTPTVRKSLTPGRILILLAGKHRGKRVVLVKVLKTGLLVINGPFRVNGCPLRRIHPQYVIATKTEIDMSDVKVPQKINNAYFKKDKKELKKARKVKKEKSKDIFKEEKKVAKPVKKNLRRRKDQAKVDRMMIAAIRKREDWRVMVRYLKSPFGIKGTQYPHRLQF